MQVIRRNRSGTFRREPPYIKYTRVIAGKAADPDRRTNSS